MTGSRRLGARVAPDGPRGAAIPGRTVRPAALLVAAPAAMGTLLWASPDVDLPSALHRHPGAAALGADVVVVQVATLGAWLCLLWLCVGVAASVTATRPGRFGRGAERIARRVAPLALRRAVEVAVGATLATGVLAAPPVSAALGAQAVAPWTPSASAPSACPPSPPGRPAGYGASASPPPSPATGPTATPDPRAPDLDRPTAGWVPDAGASLSLDRPIADGRARPAGRGSALLAPAPRGSGDGSVVVHRGDNLWDIVARRLGPGAPDAAVAEAWPSWYRANRSVIGPNPSLLLPGQVLRPPRPS